MTLKFGLKISKNWKDIKILDDAVGTTSWQNTLEKEISALIYHQYFDFMSTDYKPPRYQFCRLHMVYDVKADLTHKPYLVCDGSHVGSRGLSTKVMVAKGISV